MTSQSPLLVSSILLWFTIHLTLGSGVLTIRLTGFKNPYGRTYDGACCDPTPKDFGSTCYDECDYVMRLIVTGLGRANDHVFLFHRPLTYDSNNIVFENGDSNLLLTVLFDEWPEDDQVKMNAFFYDYDDFDHTTTLVDWFETDLRHLTNSTAETWGHFQEQAVTGNRQTDKTVLTFEWSALAHEKDEYVTTRDRKVTATPRLEPTHMTRLSTSRESTHRLRQAWTNSQDDSSTEINIEEDLYTKLPDLLRWKVASAKFKAKKENFLKSLKRNRAQKKESITQDTGGHIYTDSLVNDRPNSEEDIAASLNHSSSPRRKSGLLKRKSAIPSISRTELFKRKSNRLNIINKKELHKPESDVVQAASPDPTLVPVLVSRDSHPQNGSNTGDDKEENHLIKPPVFDNNRPFGRSRPWIKNKLSPLKSRHFIEKGKKYSDRKTTAQKHPVRQSLFSEEDMESKESTEVNQGDVYFPLPTTSKEPRAAIVLGSDQSPEQSQLNKDIKVMKSRGRMFQHARKQSRNRLHYSNSQELKVNFTDAAPSKSGDESRELEEREHDVSKTKNYFMAQRRRKITNKSASFSNHAASSKDKTPSSVVLHSDLKLDVSPVPLRENIHTRLPLTHSADYKNTPLSNLKNQHNKYMYKNSDDSVKTKMQSDKLSTANSDIRSPDKATAALLQTTYPPSLKTSGPGVAYHSKALTHFNTDSAEENKFEFQEAKKSLHTDRRNTGFFRNTHISQKSPEHSGDKNLHQLLKENNMAFDKNEPSNSPTDSRVWRKMVTVRQQESNITTTKVLNTVTTTIIPTFYKSEAASRTTKIYNSSHAPSNAAKVYASSNRSQTIMSHDSKAIVPNSEPYAQAKIFINAPAAIDRFHSRPSVQKHLQAPENILNNHSADSLDDGAAIKESVIGSNKFTEGPHKTLVSVWKNSRDVLVPRQANTELRSHVVITTTRVPTTSDLHDSRASGHIFIKSKKADTIMNGTFDSAESTFTDKHGPMVQTDRIQLKRISQEVSATQTMADRKVDKNSDPAGNTSDNSNTLISDTTKQNRSNNQMFVTDAVKEKHDVVGLKEKSKTLHAEVGDNQGQHLDNTEKESQTLTQDYHPISTGQNPVKVINSNNNEGNERNTNDTKLVAMKKYKINFTSLPEILELEAVSLPLQQDDQPDDGREKTNEYESDKYRMDLNAAQQIQGRYTIRPKTPKPPTSVELLRNSIKSLKAVKFQTHAHVQWYVTAQPVLRKAALNVAALVKQSRGYVDNDNFMSTRNDDSLINPKVEQTVSLNRIPLSDTKLHTAQSHLIINAANMNKSFVDSVNKGREKDKAGEHQPYVDFYAKDLEKTKVYVPQLSTDFGKNHEENSAKQQQHSRAQSVRKYNSLSSNADTWQPLMSSSNKGSNINALKTDNVYDSVPTDNKLNSKAAIPQAITDSVKHQDSTERELMSQSKASSVEKKYDIKINALHKFDDSTDNHQKSKLKVHSSARSFNEDQQSSKPAQTQQLLAKSFDKDLIFEKDLVTKKLNGGQSLAGPLHTDFAMNSRLTIGPLLLDSINNSRVSHNTAVILKPLTESAKNYHKSNQTNQSAFNSSSSNSTQGNTKSQEGATNVVTFDLVSSAGFKVKEEKLLRVQPEQVQNDLYEKSRKGDESLPGKQTMNNAYSSHKQISTKSSVSERTTNPRETLSHTKPVHNIILPSSEISLKQAAPHKVAPEREIRWLDPSNSTKNLHNATDNKTSFKEKHGDPSKSMSYLLDNAKNNNQPHALIIENSLITSIKTNENTQPKLLNESLKHSEENNNNIQKGNKQTKNKQVSSVDKASSDNLPIQVALTDPMEIKVNQMQSDQREKMNKKSHVNSFEGQPLIIKQNNVLQDKEKTTFVSNGVNKLHSSQQDIAEEPHTNLDSKGKLPELKKLPKLMNSMMLASKIKPHAAKGMKEDYVPVQHKNTSHSANDKVNKNMMTIAPLNGRVPQNYVQSVDKQITVTVPLATTHGLLNATTTRYDRPQISKNEKTSSTINHTQHTPSKGYDVNSTGNQTGQNVVVSEVNLLNNVVDTFNNSKTSHHLDSVTYMSDKPSNVDVIEHKSAEVGATNKTSNLENLQKNAFNKNLAYVKILHEKAVDKRTSDVTMKLINATTQTTSHVYHQSENTTIGSPKDFTLKTKLVSTRSESVRDPFKMMSLFMARQNLLGTILQMKHKEAALISSISNATFARTTSKYNNDSPRPKHADIKTNKSTSHKPLISPTKISPTVEISKIKLLNGNGAVTTSSQTKIKAEVNVKMATQRLSEEKQKTPNVKVVPENQMQYSNNSMAIKRQYLSTLSLTLAPSTSTSRTESKAQTITTTKPLTVETDKTTSSSTTRVEPSKPSSTFSSQRTSAGKTTVPPNTTKDRSAGNGKEGINMQTVKLQTLTTSKQEKSRSNYRSDISMKQVYLRPNFDEDNTKIVYPVERHHSDEAQTPSNYFSPMVFVYTPMNTLPEHGFILHTPLPRDEGKPTARSPNGLPLPKLSRQVNAVRRQSMYREMDLDKFRNYVKAIRNYPTVNVPFHGLYTPKADKNSALEEKPAELPDPVRRYGAFYTSVSNVGTVFTRYWPAVLGVSIGTIFLLTALVTSILCRQRRLLIQRVRWMDSPQHVSEPPDTNNRAFTTVGRSGWTYSSRETLLGCC